MAARETMLLILNGIHWKRRMQAVEYEVRFHLEVTDDALDDVLSAVNNAGIPTPRLLIDSDRKVADGVAQVEADSSTAACGKLREAIEQAAAAGSESPELRMKDPRPIRWED